MNYPTSTNPVEYGLTSTLNQTDHLLNKLTDLELKLTREMKRHEHKVNKPTK